MRYLEKAGNYQYDKFAVIFPPYQIWQVQNPPVPNAQLLGQANVKYVTSTYQIKSTDFIFIKKFDNVYLYKNNSFEPLAYFEDSVDKVRIKKYTPNTILLEFQKSSQSRNLIIAENYYPGWFAFIDHKKYQIEKSDSIFRKIIIPANSEKIELKYEPASFMQGKTITFATFVISLLIFLRIPKNNHYGQYRNS